MAVVVVEVDLIGFEGRAVFQIHPEHPAEQFGPSRESLVGERRSGDLAGQGVEFTEPMGRGD